MSESLGPLNEAKLEKLTSKQREAVKLVISGMTTPQIAKLLGTTQEAIYTRIASASRRLMVNDRRELIRLLCPTLYTQRSLPPKRPELSSVRQAWEEITRAS